nr:MAG TPA: hypothetical protein [Caudoviricetes sp.]
MLLPSRSLGLSRDIPSVSFRCDRRPSARSNSQH